MSARARQSRLGLMMKASLESRRWHATSLPFAYELVEFVTARSVLAAKGERRRAMALDGRERRRARGKACGGRCKERAQHSTPCAGRDVRGMRGRSRTSNHESQAEAAHEKWPLSSMTCTSFEVSPSIGGAAAGCGWRGLNCFAGDTSSHLTGSPSAESKRANRVRVSFFALDR